MAGRRQKSHYAQLMAAAEQQYGQPAADPTPPTAVSLYGSPAAPSPAQTGAQETPAAAYAFAYTPTSAAHGASWQAEGGASSWQAQGAPTWHEAPVSAQQSPWRAHDTTATQQADRVAVAPQGYVAPPWSSPAAGVSATPYTPRPVASPLALPSPSSASFTAPAAATSAAPSAVSGREVPLAKPSHFHGRGVVTHAQGGTASPVPSSPARVSGSPYPMLRVADGPSATPQVVTPVTVRPQVVAPVAAPPAGVQRVAAVTSAARVPPVVESPVALGYAISTKPQGQTVVAQSVPHRAGQAAAPLRAGTAPATPTATVDALAQEQVRV